MDNKETTFSVNITFTAEEIVNLRKIIIEAIKVKGGELIEYYRQDDKKETKPTAVIIGSERRVGNPSDEDVNRLLELIKDTRQPEKTQKLPTLITISLPL